MSKRKKGISAAERRRRQEQRWRADGGHFKQDMDGAWFRLTPARTGRIAYYRVEDQLP